MLGDQSPPPTNAAADGTTDERSARSEWPNAQSTVEDPVIMTDARSFPTRASTERLEPAMKFVLPCYGSRGDIEPSVVVGRELQRRGHDVRMAVPPNLVGFAEAAGLAAVAYGMDSQAIVETQQNYWRCRLHTPGGRGIC